MSQQTKSNLMVICAIFGLLSPVMAIAGVLYAAGSQDQKVKVLHQQMNEVRARADADHDLLVKVAEQTTETRRQVNDLHRAVFQKP